MNTDRAPEAYWLRRIFRLLVVVVVFGVAIGAYALIHHSTDQTNHYLNSSQACMQELGQGGPTPDC